MRFSVVRINVRRAKCVWAALVVVVVLTIVVPVVEAASIIEIPGSITAVVRLRLQALPLVLDLLRFNHFLFLLVLHQLFVFPEFANRTRNERALITSVRWS